jgi:hypothetical protein
MVAVTLLTVLAGFLVFRAFTRGERAGGGGMVGDMAAFDI